MPNSNKRDTHIADLGGNIALLYDNEVGQWILAKDVRHTKDYRDFRAFAYWRDGAEKLEREIKRRPYMRLAIPTKTVKAVSLDMFFASRGEPFTDEMVYG